MATIRNIFACLVHESQDCVIDLLRNLRALDPASLILLYNGGRDPKLLSDHFPFERYGAVLHPSPQPAEWGHLHQFALDCMKWACENDPFDVLTIVDSDQLAIRPGYSEYLAAHAQNISRAGVLGNSPAIQVPGTRIGPAEAALKEIELWRPLLREFPGGEQKFVHWCFWPSTIFTADAARDLVKLFTDNARLQDIMRQTRIWASEEVILPTLAAMLGYEIAANPCSYDYVQYRVAFSLNQIEAAFNRENVFWIHPVPRRYDDPLRKRIREKWNHYESVQPISEVSGRSTERTTNLRLLRTIPILEKMRSIEGWLDDREADLLIAAVTHAIAIVPNAAVVEIGSYCGRSTVVLGCALNASAERAGTKIYAIDPHDGVVGALDQGIKRVAPTLDKFLRNISNAGLGDLVEPITKRSFEVQWSQPISFLFIDGLHDYASVARDFYHFESWISPEGLVAFHDYADYYPGVKTFVDELIVHGRYEKVDQALSMIVVRRRDTGAIDTAAADRGPQESRVATFATAPLVLDRKPLVSCIMPTADRLTFATQAIRYFERQDYSNRELIILDDGADGLADLLPSDSRIRYVRMDQKRTMGFKHNLACELARGEIIVHWDDDDWMADSRISYQVGNLLAHPPNTISGLSRLLYYDPRAERAWEYIYPMPQRPWLAGGTFCYRRDFWEGRRFPDLNEGADTVFVWSLQDANLLALAKNDFYVAVVHPGNTSPKRTNDPAWHSVPLERIYRLFDEDSSFYQGLAGRAEAAAR